MSERKPKFKVGQVVKFKKPPIGSRNPYFLIYHIDRTANIYYQNEDDWRQGNWGALEEALSPLTKREIGK